MATPEMSESAPGPASDAQRALQHHSTPERSHESSGSGVSVIYHPSENGSSFESTFEALRISGDHEPDSSIEFILTPPRAPNVPALVVVDDSIIVSPLLDPVTHMPCASPDDAQRRDASSEETTQRTPRPTVLNPLVPPFRAVPIPTADEARPLTGHVILARFHNIIKDGKNMIGELRLDAKVALADLGLKPIPSLHGSALLPYARNPSGVDSFRFSVEEDEEAFSPVEEGVSARPRPGPLPLPGNARYTYAGRLAQQRNSSAPAALGGSANATDATSRGTPQKSATKSPRRRGQGTAAVQQPVLAPEPGSTSHAPKESIGSEDGAAAQSAHEAAILEQRRRSFLQHAQQVQLAQQAQLESLRAQLASTLNLYTAPSPQPFQAGRIAAPSPGLPFSPAHSPQPNSPSFTSPMLFSPPTADVAHFQNVVMGPGGHVRVVDPLELAGLSAHQPAPSTLYQRASVSSPLTDTSSSAWGSAPEASSQSAQVVDQSSSQRGASADKQKSGGRRRAHGRNKNDIGTAKKVLPEQARRKSTTPSFPLRDQERRSSIPPSSKVLPASPTQKRTVPRDDSEQVAKSTEGAVAATNPPDSSDLPRADVGKGASRVKARRAFTEIGNQAADEKQPTADSVKQRRASEPALSASADAIPTLPEPAKHSKQLKKGESQGRSDLDRASMPETSHLSPGRDFSDATCPPSPSTSTTSSSTPVPKASKGKRRWKRRGKKQSAPSPAGETEA
ncbi:hypothetical protein C6P46_001807 [Rhodotorula mucilaginosa]|uniref:Proteophosphoglycan ppg4 n=1 Tax=Rhodotorula mucilaginosa TaxID=5537 RepID=A0A9P6VUJ0_RHOMI|nr:hypothetical protein C6P46_001807 [Rhodotorula mucilaginosa]